MTMQLFKDILISLVNDVYPDLADVKKVYYKAIVTTNWTRLKLSGN